MREQKRLSPLGRGHREVEHPDRPFRPANQTVKASSTCRVGQFNVQFRGFYKLYSIDVNRPNNNADSDRGKQRGLNSPHGRRGALCAHFGWTYDYLVNGVAWGLVERMMIDAPSYDTDSDPNVQQITLTESNQEQVLNYVNSLM